jgi:polar amino acid transport system ATP-binding protein
MPKHIGIVACSAEGSAFFYRTICVTHEMHFAEDVADRVVFMDKGKIVEDAPPKVMFSTPRIPETQRFLRSILER